MERSELVQDSAIDPPFCYASVEEQIELSCGGSTMEDWKRLKVKIKVMEIGVW